jgi:hypothetical protein
MGGKSANKAGYFDKLKGLLEDYKSIFIVSVDNVSSQQMHEIRQSLRGQGVVLMGKNTMVRTLLWWNMGGMGNSWRLELSLRQQLLMDGDANALNTTGSPCPQDLHDRLARV